MTHLNSFEEYLLDVVNSPYFSFFYIKSLLVMGINLDDYEPINLPFISVLILFYSSRL